MAISLQPHYFPAVCKKCGDVTQCLRSPLMRSIRVGQCGRRERNGAPCRGDVSFIREPVTVSRPPKAEPIVVTDNLLGDLIDHRERPYDLARELDTLQGALGEQDSWGEEEAST